MVPDAGKLHPTEAKPADSEVQSQVSKDGRFQQKDAASQRKKRRHSEEETHSAGRPSSATSKKEREDEISHPAERLISTNVGMATRVKCKRKAKNKTRNRIWTQCEWHCEAGDDDQKKERKWQRSLTIERHEDRGHASGAGRTDGPRHNIPVFTVRRTRCCKLHDRGARALTASQRSRRAQCWVVVLEVQARYPGSCNPP